MLPKVLVVEDEQRWRDLFAILFEEQVGCEPIFATSITEAQEAFRMHKGDIQAIVMDACVNSLEPITQELTRQFRAEFAGPILAASSVDRYTTEIVGAGATEGVSKDEVHERLKELLSR